LSYAGWQVPAGPVVRRPGVMVHER